MRRFVARFEDDESASTARSTLREADLSPETPSIDTPFLDPSMPMPELRGIVWGGLFGGIVGAAILYAMVAHALWLPRISPIMTAGSYALVFLGFGLGTIVGGFFGGVVGTARPVEVPSEPRIAVNVPDDRVGEVGDLLREHGATSVGEVAIYHEHPLADRVESAPGESER